MTRRALGILMLVGTLVATAGSVTTAAVATPSSQSASLDASVLAQLNQIRVSHHLVPLALSPSLNKAADEHSQEMLAKGYFAHNSASGAPFWKRIEVYYPSQPDTYWSVGENLFWSSGSVSATTGMNAWMASPEHRANILDPIWRQIGVAAASASHAPGTYGGLNVTVITTDFGVRRSD